MGKVKIIFGSILILLGIVLSFFFLAVGVILITAGISSIVFHKDSDPDDQNQK